MAVAWIPAESTYPKDLDSQSDIAVVGDPMGSEKSSLLILNLGGILTRTGSSKLWSSID